MPPRTPLLDRVTYPSDLRNFSHDQLKQLADELRAETVDTVIKAAFGRRLPRP